MRSIAHVPLVTAMLLCLAACDDPPRGPGQAAQASDVSDPIEGANRDLFEANQYADRNVMKPVAIAYRDNIPAGVQRGLHNLLANLGEPVVGLNDLLQGNPDRAWTALRRFVVNTTIGGLGIFDIAARWDLPHHEADFGQTFGVWGMDPGPYFELPVFGPSDLRDTLGLLVGFVVDPFFFVGGSAAITYANVAKSGASTLDQRTRYLDALDAIESTSIDYYATMRSLYLQHRQGLVEEGKYADETHRGRVDVKFGTPRTPDATAAPLPSSPAEETGTAK